jgi:hypothetical protein
MLLAVAAVASSTQNSTSTVNDVEPGLLGFLVVAALGLALYFLLRSMNKHLRKLGPKPEDALLSIDDLEATDGVRGDAVAGQVLTRQDADPARAKPIAGA